MWPYPWTHVGTPSHLGHMDRVSATMPSQAHAGAAQEAPDIGHSEGQDFPLVRPSSCNVKGGIPSSRGYLSTYLHRHYLSRYGLPLPVTNRVAAKEQLGQCDGGLVTTACPLVLKQGVKHSGPLPLTCLQQLIIAHAGVPGCNDHVLHKGVRTIAHRLEQAFGPRCHWEGPCASPSTTRFQVECSWLCRLGTHCRQASGHNHVRGRSR